MRCLLVPSKYERKYYTIILACWVLICGLVFCGTFVWHIEITLQLRFVFVCHCDIFQTSQLHYLSFQRFTFLMTSELHWIMEIVRTCELFIEVTLSFFSNIIFLAPHLFDNVDIDVKKNDVSLTLFCGTFALHLEVMLELRFEFIRHSDVLFLTSQLWYLFFDAVTLFMTL